MSSVRFLRGGTYDGKCSKAKEQIISELFFLNHRIQILVGGGNQTEIAFNLPASTDRPEAPFLKNAKKAFLCGQMHFTHLIKKKRSSIGLFDETRPFFFRTGKSPLYMSEEEALNQVFRKHRAVEHNKGTGRAIAVFMDHSGQEFFTRPRLSAEENTDVAGGALGDLVETVY